MAYDKTNLPDVQPWMQGQPRTAMSSVGETCRAVVSFPEENAWHTVQAIVHAAIAEGMSHADIFARLAIVHDCRTWPRYEAEWRALLARYRASSAAPQPTTLARYVGSPKPAGVPGTPPSARPSLVDKLFATPKPKTPAASSSSTAAYTTPTTPDSSGCACTESKKVTPMQSQFTPTPGPQDFSSSCGGYRQPDPAATGLANLSVCDVAKCSGGSRIGLEMMPFLRTLVPGVVNPITLGFTRPSRLVSIAFTRRQLPTAASAYNPDDITISGWRTSSLNQAFDIPRSDTTFAGVDLNAQQVSLINYFEDGDDSFSPIVHGQSPLPRFIPATDIGTNQGSVSFDLLLDNTVVGNQQVFFYAYVIFTG